MSADQALMDRLRAVLAEQGASLTPQGFAEPATLQSVLWTLDELLEEAEDSDYASQDTSRVRDLSIARDLVAVLRAALEPGDDTRA
jgi:hypothetical protein